HRLRPPASYTRCLRGALPICRDRVHGPVPAGERLEQRRREHDVAQEGGLDDEASQPAGPRGRLPAGSRPCPPASCRLTSLVIQTDRKSTRLNSSPRSIYYDGL